MSSLHKKFQAVSGLEFFHHYLFFIRVDSRFPFIPPSLSTTHSSPSPHLSTKFRDLSTRCRAFTTHSPLIHRAHPATREIRAQNMSSICVIHSAQQRKMRVDKNFKELSRAYYVIIRVDPFAHLFLPNLSKNFPPAMSQSWWGLFSLIISIAT